MSKRELAIADVMAMQTSLVAYYRRLKSSGSLSDRKDVKACQLFLGLERTELNIRRLTDEQFEPHADHVMAQLAEQRTILESRAAGRT